MTRLRHLARLFAVVGTVLALSSCATSADNTGTTAAESTPASDSATATINLARLAELRDDFPPGLTPVPAAGPSKVSAENARLVSDVVSYGKPFTVDPPECRTLLKPVDAREGADKAGIGAGGPQPPALTVSAVHPVTAASPLPLIGCDRSTFEVESAVPDGVAERLEGPNIDEAITAGIRIVYDGGVEYYYFAVLDGGAYVEVSARMAPDFQPEPVLTELLTKAVAAIRG